ncbi:MAG: hypothetical protein V5A28_10385, partial [Haloarculaceae archaeon]
MSRLRFLLRRVASLVVTVWTVFTLAFLYVAFTPLTAGALESDLVATSPSDPLVDQYVAWVGWFLTVWDEPVMGTVLEHLVYTATYLLPAVVFAVV